MSYYAKGDTVYVRFHTRNPATSALTDADALPVCKTYAANVYVPGGDLTVTKESTGTYIASLDTSGLVAEADIKIVAEVTLGGVDDKAVIFDERIRMLPAAVPGDEMDLVDAPNATAVTAIQSGLALAGGEMDLVDAPNSTAITAIQSGLGTSGNQTAIKNDTEAILLDTGTDGVIVATNNDKTGYGLADGAITAAKLGADCITNAKIADDAIAAENLATGAITSDALAASAVDEIWDEIQDGTITARVIMKIINALIAGDPTVTDNGDGTATVVWTDEGGSPLFTWTVAATGSRITT